jgi:DNA-binding response OmpR family regulator
MLTAKGDDTDKILGFEYGADDYLTKPFNILELKSRVRAILRRSSGLGAKDKNTRLITGDIIVDTDARSVTVHGEEAQLTAKEFDLIEMLMRNPGRVYSRENLLNIVWGYEYPGDIRTVDVHIRRLREKLEDNPADPNYIMTKWGVGYYFKA